MRKSKIWDFSVQDYWELYLRIYLRVWGVLEFIKWDIFERLEYMIEHEIWESGGYLKVRNIWEIIRYLQEIIVHIEHVWYYRECVILKSEIYLRAF